MNINMEDYMENKNIGVILDKWHLMGQYQVQLIDGTLFREDLQLTDEEMEIVTECSLVEWLLEVIRNKEALHGRSDEFFEDKAALINFLKSVEVDKDSHCHFCSSAEDSSVMIQDMEGKQDGE